WIIILLFPTFLMASSFFLYPDGFFVSVGDSVFLEIWNYKISLGFSFERKDVHYKNLILLKVKKGETIKRFAFSVGNSWSISMDLKVKSSFPVSTETRTFYTIGSEKAFAINEGRSSTKILGYSISSDYFSYISHHSLNFSKALLKIPRMSVGMHSGDSIFSVGFADKGFFSGVGWFKGFCVDFGLWKDFDLKGVKGSLNLFLGLSQKGLYPSFYLRLNDPFSVRVIYDEKRWFAGVEF
ncbi:MAG: hypothetical protein ACXQTX_06385, partial [Candidatus Syntropharchaeia archaeon]